MPRKKIIATIDCETDPFKFNRIPYPFVWGYYDGKTYKEFDTVKELIKFVEKKNVIIYAHNGGKFDYWYLLDYLEDFSQPKIINGRLSKFKIGNAEFRDSLNILPVSLDKYAKTKIDYSIFEAEEREKPHNKKLISDYLKDDCKFLHEIISRSIDECGNKLTLAGNAFAIYKDIFKIQTGEKLEVNRHYDSAKRFYNDFKPYYFGGRVECFKGGILKGNFESYDIKSAYPFAMLTKMPYGERYIEYDDINNLSYEEIGRSFINISCISKGVFPYKDEKGFLRFPNDGKEREFKITGFEYLAGIETNNLEKINIKSVKVFTETIDFSKYVEYFYSKKKAAEESDDKGGRLIAKLYLNSLYGKWATNPEKHKNYFIVPPDHIEIMVKNGFEFDGLIGDKVLMTTELDDDEKIYYNIATASAITGYVRAYLFRGINSSENVIYCDTDCIVAEKVKVDVGEKLGQWELEERYNSVAVAGKKLYSFRIKSGGFKTASKGVRATAEEIYRVAKGEEVEVNNEAPTFKISSPVKKAENSLEKYDDISRAVFISRKLRKTF